MIRKNKKAMLVSLVVFLTLAAEGRAQIEPNRQRIRERLNTLRLLRMTQALDLSDEQTSKIFPLSNRLEKEKIEINNQIGGEIQALRDMIKGGNPKEEELLSKYATVQDLRKKIRNKDDEFENFLEEQLTPTQKIKYLIFSVDFFREVGEQLNRARVKQSRPANPPRKKS